MEAAPDAGAQGRIVAADPALNLRQGRYSSDGRWILFNAIAPGDANVSTLSVAPTGGGRWTRISDGRWFDDKGRWSTDGRQIYFVSNRGGRLDVWTRRIDPETGAPSGPVEQVTHFDELTQVISPNISQLDIATDAQRLVVPMADISADVWVLDDVQR